jgi:4-azaleucine resistance transporter AzlC
LNAVEPAPTRREAAAAGARAIIPLTLGVVPFGVAYGVVVSQSDIALWVGIGASIVVYAGASQLSLVELLDSGASSAAAIGTALVINARLGLYSAALAPAFRQFPLTWRFALPQLLTDQSATLSLLYYEQVSDPRARRWYYLGASTTIAAGWMAATLTGAWGGSRVPESLELEFAIPLVFVSLLVPVVRDRPSLVAALVGGAVAFATVDLPSGLNILCGALAGIAAGVVADR